MNEMNPNLQTVDLSPGGPGNATADPLASPSGRGGASTASDGEGRARKALSVTALRAATAPPEGEPGAGAGAPGGEGNATANPLASPSGRGGASTASDGEGRARKALSVTALRAATAPPEGEPGAGADAPGGPNDPARRLAADGPGQSRSARQLSRRESQETSDKSKAFRDLIRGEYREQFAEETQRLINRRFRETERLRTLAEGAQPVLDALARRYGLPDADAEALLRAVEDEAAASERTQREADERASRRRSTAETLSRMQLAKWRAEAEALRARHPDFDLHAWEGDAVFRMFLRGGWPMERAWRQANMEALIAAAKADAERAVTDHIRARGTRPEEAGAAASPAFAVREDVAKLSDAEVKRILARVGEKEKISFG